MGFEQFDQNDSSQIEWNDKYQELHTLYGDVMGQILQSGDNPYGGKMGEFITLLQDNYPKSYNQYVAYHVIIGSTPQYKISPKIDFPGEHSVKRWLQEQLDNRSQFVKE